MLAKNLTSAPPCCPWNSILLRNESFTLSFTVIVWHPVSHILRTIFSFLSVCSAIPTLSTLLHHPLACLFCLASSGVIWMKHLLHIFSQQQPPANWVFFKIFPRLALFSVPNRDKIGSSVQRWVFFVENAYPAIQPLNHQVIACSMTSWSSAPWVDRIPPCCLFWAHWEGGECV